MFPISIKYRRKLNSNAESDLLFDHIENELIRLKIEKIERSDSQINFQNPFSNIQGRWHLMATIDKGNFKLDRRFGKLEYLISLIRTFYITLAMSCFFALISQSYGFGLISFIWLFGMNYIITLIRQRVFLKKLLKIKKA